jgi:transcription elongation factor Elf1
MQARKNYNMPKRMYPITATCVDCGAEFEISVKEQLFAQEDKGFVLPKRCKSCRDERKNNTIFIICEDCGEPFEFSVSEQKFYAQNGFKDPKRCKSCRKNKKGKLNGQNIAKEDK